MDIAEDESSSDEIVEVESSSVESEVTVSLTVVVSVRSLESNYLIYINDFG